MKVTTVLIERTVLFERAAKVTPVLFERTARVTPVLFLCSAKVTPVLFERSARVTPVPILGGVRERIGAFAALWAVH